MSMGHAIQELSLSVLESISSLMFPFEKSLKSALFLLLGGVLLSPLSGFEQGVYLPRPGHEGLLVEASGFHLKEVAIAPETKVLIFYYSASWCAPCKSMSQGLKEALPNLNELMPGFQFITYSLDHSPGERGKHLKGTDLPWPAINPNGYDREGWQINPKIGTPSFQVFAVEADHLKAITSIADIETVLKFTHDYLIAARSHG